MRDDNDGESGGEDDGDSWQVVRGGESFLAWRRF
jgi:hypothetical protein